MILLLSIAAMGACANVATVDKDDAAIYAVVLADLASRGDTMLSKEGAMLIAADASTIDPQQTPLREQIQHGRCTQLVAMHSSLLTRNAVATPITTAITATAAWRIASRKELDTPLYMQHDGTRTIVRLALPGFDVSRSRAMVRLHFLWSEHAAEAIYVLNRSRSSWQIDCSDLFFHL
jgi:hypothetical protein